MRVKPKRLLAIAGLLACASGALARDDDVSGSTGQTEGGLTLGKASPKVQPGYWRLMLKEGNRHLASNGCSAEIVLRPGAPRRNDPCAEWQVVRVDSQWFKLVLSSKSLYLDGCGPRPGAVREAVGAAAGCQMWTQTKDKDGWFKLQLRKDGRFLDADHCSDRLGMNAGSDWKDGACQRWQWGQQH